MLAELTIAEFVDRAAVGDVIQRERAARDGRLWADMAACYHPDAFVDVSWFHGGSDAFVEASRKVADGPTLSFHSMSPAVVTVNGDRALAETGCALHGMTELDGVDVALVGYTRLLWRAQRSGDRWLIAGLRAMYISDMLLPRNPSRVPQIDDDALRAFRPSYKYLSYIITKSGRTIRDDLPGIDRPESVVALRAAEQQWLERSIP
jgi:SnoaL-like domain